MSESLEATFSLFLEGLLTYRTPTLAEVSYEFGSVPLFTSLFVCLSATQDIRSGPAVFFLFFCMKLDSHKVRKVTKPNI